MFTLNCKGRLLVGDKPLIMGIINVTPDSFYEGSRFSGKDAVLDQADKLLKEGADILDIGGQSTRPGSEMLATDEELERVIEVIEAVHNHFPEATISIDTFQSRVAVEAVAAGAGIVNDVSGGTMDAQMITAVGGLGVPYICMHIKGTPGNMQKDPVYENVVREVLDFFIRKTAECRQAGINDIILDPGFGFGKTIAHNFELLKNLAAFKLFEKPLLLGVSRKSTIYRLLGTTATEALNGTSVLNTMGLLNGADILRVHDVKEAVEVRKLVTEYLK